MELKVKITRTDEHRYEAMFANPRSELPSCIQGCPLGRGSTMTEANEDLAYRASIGSDIKLCIRDFTVIEIVDLTWNSKSLDHLLGS